MRHWGSIFLLGLAACTPHPEIEANSNAVVSTSLCADGYLHAFPALETRLAALSWQSRSALSVTPNHLQTLPQTDSDPERAILWKNAVRVSNAGGSGDIDLQWGEDFETVWSNLDLLSAELNVANPTAMLKLRLKNLETPKNKPVALYLDRSGATAGSGTFVDEVIRRAGAENIIQTRGWQSLDTEDLVQLQPDFIITSFMGSNYSGINDRAFRHEALAKKIKSLPHINIPGKFWPCAGPGLIDATETLSRAMSEL